MSNVNDKPTEQERAATRCRVMSPIINADHLVFSVKLVAKCAGLPLDVRTILHDNFVTFANDQQLWLDKIV